MANLNEVNEKIADGCRKIEDGVVEGYKKIESGVVSGYKKIEDKFTEAFMNGDGSLKTGGMDEKATNAYRKIENSVVGGFTKITDKFVSAFLTREGESVGEAKERINAQQSSYKCDHRQPGEDACVNSDCDDTV